MQITFNKIEDYIEVIIYNDDDLDAYYRGDWSYTSDQIAESIRDKISDCLKSNAENGHFFKDEVKVCEERLEAAECNSDDKAILKKAKLERRDEIKRLKSRLKQAKHALEKNNNRPQVIRKLIPTPLEELAECSE